jgi:hypothetical protein
LSGVLTLIVAPHQIAKNCRTSVEMLEKHYAVHLKNTLDASAINVLKPKRDFRKKNNPRARVQLAAEEDLLL